MGVFSRRAFVVKPCLSLISVQIGQHQTILSSLISELSRVATPKLALKGETNPTSAAEI